MFLTGEIQRCYWGGSLSLSELSPAIPGSLRREARQRVLAGQDTCEGAVAVKIIHPAPGGVLLGALLQQQ